MNIKRNVRKSNTVSQVIYNQNKNLIVVSDHTIIKPDRSGMLVLDVGSRNYGFALPMAEMGCHVVAVEPDDSVPGPEHSRIHLSRIALVASKNIGFQDLVKWGSGEGNHLDCVKGHVPDGATRQMVRCYSILQIMEMTEIDFWDIVKLDCEGSEYEILADWPGPIAGQITVEFHDFTGANPDGEKTYDRIFSHLGQWYDVVQHEKTTRFVAKVDNYWDTLLVLKDGNNNT